MAKESGVMNPQAVVSGGREQKARDGCRKDDWKSPEVPLSQRFQIGTFTARGVRKAIRLALRESCLVWSGGRGE